MLQELKKKKKNILNPGVAERGGCTLSAEQCVLAEKVQKRRTDDGALRWAVPSPTNRHV